jgi:hypothetical protein
MRHQILKVFCWFSRHCSYHLVGNVLGAGVRERYIDQAVSGEWGVKGMIGETEE